MPSDLVRALNGAFLMDPMAAFNQQLTPQDFDWAGLGAAVSSLHRTVPGASCLLGPLEAQVRRRLCTCQMAVLIPLRAADMVAFARWDRAAVTELCAGAPF